MVSKKCPKKVWFPSDNTNPADLCSGVTTYRLVDGQDVNGGDKDE